jgi:hypothetical protein
MEKLKKSLKSRLVKITKLKKNIPPESKLKYGYDHLELIRLIETVVKDHTDCRALTNKIAMFIGFTNCFYNDAIQKDIDEYDNLETRYDYIKKFKSQS